MPENAGHEPGQAKQRPAEAGREPGQAKQRPAEAAREPGQAKQRPAEAAREQVQTDRTPPPGGSYSQAIRWGNLLFLSGQTPRDLNRAIVQGPFRAQAVRVYENLRLLAEAGGARMEDALQVTVYLADMADAAEADAVFAEVFPEPRPARTTVGAHIPVSIEVDAVFGLRS